MSLCSRSYVKANPLFSIICDHRFCKSPIVAYLEEERAHVRVLALGLLEAGEVVGGENEVSLLPVPAAQQRVTAVPEDALAQSTVLLCCRGHIPLR